MRLVTLSGGQTLSFPLRQGSTIIGRHPSCHICIPSRSISRRHAQCYIDGPNASIRDLGSSHGTFINGERVERAELRDGDVVVLGGLQLRFEAGEGAPHAYGARPVDDVVVHAQPAGGEAPAGAAPFPQEPPPAPTDFPDTADAEDTPADSSFVPQPYAAGQQTALGPAFQPQLFIRDGRWYLRDPRTGREIEIAPKGGEAAVARPEGVELRRPNIRLLIAAVAAAVVLVIGFTVVFLSPRGPDIKGPEFPLAEYNRILDTAIGDIQERNFDPALAKLEDLARKRRNIETARHLGQYAHLMKAAGDDLEKLNWTEARRYLDSILNTSSASDRAIAFAKEKLAWLHREQTCFGIYRDTLRRIEAGGDVEENLLEGYNALRQLPEDTAAAKKAKADVDRLRQRIAGLYTGRADRAMAQSKWAEALEHLQGAVPFSEDKAKIRKQIADCQRYGTEAEVLKQAREAIRDKRYEAAREALKRIEPGIHLDEAKALLAQIDREAAQQARDALKQQILKLYEEGAGAKAVELIKEHKFEELYYIIERVQRIEELLKAGKKAEEEKRYEDARQAYQGVLSVESDQNNAYAKQGKQLLDDLTARGPAIAAEYTGNGYKVLMTDPVAARKWFDDALKLDPNHERAKGGLEVLKRTAQSLWNDGSRLKMDGQPYAARNALRRAKEFAPPNSDLYQRIIQELETLPKD